MTSTKHTKSDITSHTWNEKKSPPETITMPLKKKILNQGYEGRDYQPYLTTTHDSDQSSNTGDCGASP